MPKMREKFDLGTEPKFCLFICCFTYNRRYFSHICDGTQECRRTEVGDSRGSVCLSRGELGIRRGGLGYVDKV